MKTKSILLLLLIASAMIQVFLYLCLCSFLPNIQDQALVASKHLLVETEDKNLVDNAVHPPVDIGTKSGQTESGIETKNDKSLDGGDQHKVCKMNVRVVVK